MLILIYLKIIFILNYNCYCKNNLFEWEKLWSKSYYQILQIEENSQVKDIKKAYRRLAVTLHPDKLQLNNHEEKAKAEQNFVRLAKAYEVLSDDKVKRKRYDYLLKHEGILEYPDDLNYNWEWIDQRIGLTTMSHRSGSQPREKDRNEWTYEDAQKFFKEASKDDGWSWEKDTTLKDIQENPLVFILILVSIGVSIYFPTIFKYITQQSKSKPSRENILQKVKNNLESENSSSQSNNNNSNNNQSNNQKNNSNQKSFGRNIRLKRKELSELLFDYLEELALYCSRNKVNNQISLDDIRKELEKNQTVSYSDEEIEHFCIQLKDQGIIDSYIELLQSFVQYDEQIQNESSTFDTKNSENNENNHNNQNNKLFEIDISEGLVLLENITSITEDYRNRKRTKGDIKKDNLNEETQNEIPEVDSQQQQQQQQQEQDEEKEKDNITQLGSNQNIIINRQWTVKELNILSKGIQKYPGGTRQRWEAITSYMNQQLKPIDLFTKEECLEQYQNFRKKPLKNIPSTTSTPNDFIQSTSITNSISINSLSEQWSSIQQQQLEEGLKKYPQSCNLSKTERWKAISDMVDNKSPGECIKRYKEINELIKSKNNK